MLTLLIRLAMGSIANTVLIPMQDVLGLGEEARMNVPSKGEGNWAWRVTKAQLSARNAGWLRELAEESARIS